MATSKRLTLEYGSTKTYTHAEGLSCCFRQWRAQSHCRHFHGYALKVHIEFRSNMLDDTNWVVDFGGLKEIKQWLKDNFDHKMLIARDDPMLGAIYHPMINNDVADIRLVEATGCEAFAREIMEQVYGWALQKYGSRVTVYSVAINEHESNGAIVFNKGVA